MQCTAIAAVTCVDFSVSDPITWTVSKLFFKMTFLLITLLTTLITYILFTYNPYIYTYKLFTYNYKYSTYFTNKL